MASLVYERENRRLTLAELPFRKIDLTYISFAIAFKTSFLKHVYSDKIFTRKRTGPDASGI